MKRIVIACIVFLLAAVTAGAQPDRIGAGLSFAQKIRFNQGDTGNPGLNLKTWIDLDKRKNMNIVPSITVYNPHSVKPNSSYYTTTYLFHGDLDFQYRFFKEKTLSVVGTAGVNYTHLISTVTMLISLPDPPQGDATFAFGPSIGGGLEMRMASHWDFNVGAKYIFPGLVYKAPGTVSIFDENQPKLLSSPLTALVIEVTAVYYFWDRGRGYRR